MSGIASIYLKLLERRPYVTKGITCGIIKSLADYTGQLLDNKDDNENVTNWKTIRAKLIFGCFIDAPMWHAFYIYLNARLDESRLVGKSLFLRTIVGCFFDQVFFTPFFYVVWYFFIGLLEGKQIEEINVQLKEELRPTITAAWKLWAPYTFIQMYFLPPMLWVPTGNLVSYMFATYLKLRDIAFQKKEG